jgi:c-di-GMP-binding flagellar brake protein YcgR
MFESFYLETALHKDKPAIKITFPLSMERDQKRNYLRVAPPPGRPLYVRFNLEGIGYCMPVSNISGGGIGFYSILDDSELPEGMEIRDVSIGLPDRPLINCMAVIYMSSRIHNPVLVDGEIYRNYCGAEFQRLDESVRDQIIQYVIDTERAELKRRSREFW